MVHPQAEPHRVRAEKSAGAEIVVACENCVNHAVAIRPYDRYRFGADDVIDEADHPGARKDGHAATGAIGIKLPRETTVAETFSVADIRQKYVLRLVVAAGCKPRLQFARINRTQSRAVGRQGSFVAA